MIILLLEKGNSWCVTLLFGGVCVCRGQQGGDGDYGLWNNLLKLEW